MAPKKPAEHKTTGCNSCLIPDVIDIILRQLYSQNVANPAENRRSLSRYSLISKAWRHPSQRLLFQEVIIRTPRQLQLLKCAANSKTKQGRFLGGSVRILQMRVDDASEAICVLPSDIAPAMRLFPRLYLLRLDVYRVTSFSFSVIHALQNTPPIQAVMIHKTDVWCSGGVVPRNKTSLHLQLLQIRKWRLRHFCMDGDFDLAPLAKSIPPSAHRFFEIQLGPQLTSGKAGKELMDWMLKNSMETIKIISTPFSTPVIEQLANQLLSLEYDLKDSFGGRDSLTFPNAKELMWIRVHWIKSSTGLTLFPRGLVHLGIDLQRTPYAITRWKELASFLPKTVKQISVINIISRYASEVERERRNIKEALGGHIQVRLYDTINTAIWRPSFLPEKAFARQRTLNNFKAMNRAVRELHESRPNISRQ